MKESMHNWLNESMNQWTDESVNRWRNKAMNQWITRWINQSTISQSVNQPIKQPINKSGNQQISESMTQSVPCPLVFNILKWKLQSCALFVDRLSQIEARTCGNRDPTSATPGPTLPEKTEGFVPEIFFTREFTCFRAVTLPNYLMMGGWHHDVVDMMVGLLTMTIVRNLEVFKLNFHWL